MIPVPPVFANSWAADPHDESGLDIMMIDLGESCLCAKQASWPRGFWMIWTMPAGDLEQAAELKAKAEASMTQGVATDKIAQKEVMELFEDPMWDQVWQSCLNCGA